MAGQYGAWRFGWDEPARIASSTGMYLLGDELPPEEPMYQPIVPFYPGIIDGSTGTQIGTTTTQHQVWSSSPTRCDLSFYQGDDVVITLTIEDPTDDTPDMSTAWDWSAQVRVLHTYHSTLINTFSVKDEYSPPVPQDHVVGFTQVTLFLPRSENVYVGRYRWDLYAKSPFTISDLPRPPDVPEPEPWPPTDQIRTWLYGIVTILPRVTSTDILPADPDAGGGGVPVGQYVTPAYFVGPNGRVP